MAIARSTDPEAALEKERERKQGWAWQELRAGSNVRAIKLGIEHSEAHRAVNTDSTYPKVHDPLAQLAAITTEARKRNRFADREIALTEAEQFASWLMEGTDIHELPTLISWLEGCNPRNVIAVLRRCRMT